MEQTQKIDKRKLRQVSKTERMKLDPAQAKRVELMPCSPDAKHGRSHYKVFIFDCSEGCGAEIRVSYGQLYTSTGKCACCVQRKKPYQHLHGMLIATARHRSIDVDLTYDEFLEFTKVETCTYCNSPIEWEMWSSGRERYSKAYNLDRKDNAKGYSKDNCVVCCTACNFIRRDELTHEEMLVLRPGLEEIMKQRRSEVAC
jgi:hypothetical protein